MKRQWQGFYCDSEKKSLLLDRFFASRARRGAFLIGLVGALVLSSWGTKQAAAQEAVGGGPQPRHRGPSAQPLAREGRELFTILQRFALLLRNGLGPVLPRVDPVEFENAVRSRSIDVAVVDSLFEEGREATAVGYPVGGRGQRARIYINRNIWNRSSRMESLSAAVHGILTILGYDDAQARMSGGIRNVTRDLLDRETVDLSISYDFAPTCGLGHKPPRERLTYADVIDALNDCSDHLGRYAREITSVSLSPGSFAIVSLESGDSRSLVYFDPTRRRVWARGSLYLTHAHSPFGDSYRVESGGCEPPFRAARTEELREANRYGLSELAGWRAPGPVTVSEDESSFPYLSEEYNLATNMLQERTPSYGGWPWYSNTYDVTIACVAEP